jgi:hypothetical protein
MSTSEELGSLIQRLRGGVYGVNRIALCHEAADAIERLQSLALQERAAERERCAKHLLEVAGECPEGGAVRSTLEACAGALLMGGLTDK